MTAMPIWVPAAQRVERPMEPERRLMAAVLEDAIRCYRRETGRAERERRRLFVDAARWIYSDDASWPFSAVNVCAALGINVGYLRANLAREPSGRKAVA